MKVSDSYQLSTFLPPTIYPGPFGCSALSRQNLFPNRIREQLVMAYNKRLPSGEVFLCQFPPVKRMLIVSGVSLL